MKNKELRLTDANFKKEVLDSEIPVLVDFWGSWCPPCKMVEPIVDKLTVELDGKMKIGKINVDQNPKTTAEFQISGVPTFLLFEKGKILNQAVGACSTQQLLEIVKKAGILVE
jgi:thioredoxin 1